VTSTNTTTATQARVLALLRGGCVWSRDELAERLADEVQLVGDGVLAEQVPQAVDQLVAGGLAHPIDKSLLAISRKGERGEAAADPDDAGALQVSSESAGTGILEPVNDRENRIIGGAEDLDLDPFSAGARQEQAGSA
jgi:hypothetical protein